MVRYLLACRCGRSVPVDSIKAGQTIECECGNLLEVPTLGGLKKLQRAPEEKREVSVKWAARQQVFLAGFVICMIGLGIAGFFALNRPIPPPHQRHIERIPQIVESLSIIETLQLWKKLERGLPEGVGLEDQKYRELHRAYLRRTGVALFSAGVGVLAMIISLFIPKRLYRRQ